MTNLNIEESINLAKKYGIKTAPMEYAANEKELKDAIDKIGFPSAIKVVSSKIVHKTEAGGVELPITSLRQARAVFGKMKKIKGFEKVVVQKMLKGTELIIGGKRDVQFGPTVIVGLGGIYVEILQDFAIGICPLNSKNADEMLKQLKTYKILQGARTKKAVNFAELKKLMLKVSRLMENEPNVLELDLNPVIANKKEAVAVDARVLFG